jgi:hypothetical protein
MWTAADGPNMQGLDILSAALGGVATFGLLAGFDLATGSEVSWLFNTALALGTAVVVLYVRLTTEPAEDAS